MPFALAASFVHTLRNAQFGEPATCTEPEPVNGVNSVRLRQRRSSVCGINSSICVRLCVMRANATIVQYIYKRVHALFDEPTDHYTLQQVQA